MGVIYFDIRIRRHFQNIPVHYNITYELIMTILTTFSSSSFISSTPHISYATSLHGFNFSLCRSQIVRFWDTHDINLSPSKRNSFHHTRQESRLCRRKLMQNLLQIFESRCDSCQSGVRTSLLKMSGRDLATQVLQSGR